MVAWYSMPYPFEHDAGMIHPSCEPFTLPQQTSEELNLPAQLEAVPEDGLVLDIGSGMGLALAALIRTKRPDLHVISLDPGFRKVTSRNRIAHHLHWTVQNFEHVDKVTLLDNDDWQKSVVAGYGESLPLADESVDMVVSYDGIPAHSRSEAIEFDEIVRVLKVGGVALTGPMQEATSIGWHWLASNAADAGTIASFEPSYRRVSGPDGHPVDYHFTTLRK